MHDENPSVAALPNSEDPDEMLQSVCFDNKYLLGLQYILI